MKDNVTRFPKTDIERVASSKKEFEADAKICAYCDKKPVSHCHECGADICSAHTSLNLINLCAFCEDDKDLYAAPTGSKSREWQ